MTYMLLFITSLDAKSFDFCIQLSSKCDNRLFRIMFEVPKLGKYPFLEANSLPIRCVSRSRSTRTASITLRKSSNKTYYGNGCESPGPDDGSMQLITNIVREAKLSPSSKRIKLGQDVPFVMFKEVRQANKVHHPDAWTVNQVTFWGLCTVLVCGKNLIVASRTLPTMH